jgi:hypothetical protein
MSKQNHDHDREFREREVCALEKIANELAANLPAIEADLNLLQRGVQSLVILLSPKADKLTGTLIPKGESPMIARKVEAPLTVTPGTTGTTVVVETAQGVIVPTVGPIAFASDNPAVAVYNADGTWAAIAPGVANMSQLDSTNGLTDSTQLTVQAAPPPPPDALVGTLIPNAARKR